MRMRLLLLVLTSVASCAGCSCCGKVRNWFHKGAPCGTRTLAPALTAAPVATQAPIPVAQPVQTAPPVQMAPPMQYAAPVATMVQPAPCCVPCCPDPCSVPCCEDVVIGSSGWVPSGGVYSGNYGSIQGDCGCSDVGAIQYAPAARSTDPASSSGSESSTPSQQLDPRPLNESI